MGVTRGWQLGRVAQQWIFEPSMNKVVPYVIRLDNGESIYAPDDTTNSCRNPLRFSVGQAVEVHMGNRGWVLGRVVSQWKFLAEINKQVPYEVALETGGLAHAMEDTDWNIRLPGAQDSKTPQMSQQPNAPTLQKPLRFSVGEQVEVSMGKKGWVPGRVAAQWRFLSEIKQQVPYEIVLDGGGLAHAMDDTDWNIRTPVSQHKEDPPQQQQQQQQRGSLRFDLAARVSVAMGKRGWLQGNIVHLWRFLPELGRQVPYEVRLDGGEIMHVTADTEELCRDGVGSTSRPESSELRFDVGDRVMVAMGRQGWQPATVVHQWQFDTGMKKKVPYHAKLDIGPLVNIGQDTAAYIKDFVPNLV